MTRSTKKRNRSKIDSTEKTSNKKSKPTSDKKSVDMAASSPGDSKLDGSVCFSTPVETPKGKLTFENTPSADSSSTNALESAPSWARELFTKLDRIEKTIETVSKATSSLHSTVNKLTARVNTLEMENLIFKEENTELREKLLNLEFHQRRNNLVFEGIPESNVAESGHDCYKKIMQCLSELPDMNLMSIRIDRCHRLGPKQGHISRPIIARFNWYGDLMDIMSRRSFLPAGVYVREDFPDEWIDRRRLLRPILNLAKRHPRYKDSSFLSRDKLIIDGKQYTISPRHNLAELPSDLKPSSSCEIRNDHTIAFLGPHSVFSNFHPAKFTENKVRYNCVEQMIQAEKAALFKDTISLEKIMKLRCPFRIKSAGNRIRNFDKSLWGKQCKAIATRAVTAKFQQNQALANILKSTGSTDIVESSRDSVWGTGLHLRDPKALDKSSWKGKGLMSEILQIVRSSLK